MIHSEFRQVEFAQIKNGTGMVRNKVVDIKTVKNFFNETNAYISLGRYKNLRDWVDEHGSVGGNDLPVWYDYITYDFDHRNTKEIYNFLMFLESSYEIEQFRLYFSGNKGFHIQIPTQYFGLSPHPNLYREIRAIAFTLGEGWNYDDKIYDKARIFRIPNTIHSETKLYKISLSVDDLEKGIDHILELAKTSRKLEEPPDVMPKNHLISIAKDAQKKTKKEKTKDTPKGLVYKPPRKKLCIYTLLEGVGEGERDSAGLRIAVHFKKEGLPQDMVLGLVREWNKRNDPPLEDKDIERIVNQAFSNAYDFGCFDPILSKACDEDCFLFKSRHQGSIFLDIEALENDYKTMVRLRKESKIITGIRDIDEATRGLAPQMVMYIVARAASFKSAILQNILMGYSYSKPALWFSQEMPASLVYERLVQIDQLISGADVEDKYVKGIGVAIDFKKYRNFYVDTTAGLSTEDIEQRIILFKESISPDLYLVGVDYLQIISGRGRLFEKMEQIAPEIKQIAKRTNTAIVALSQTSREEGGEGTKEIGMSGAKGGGGIEDSADVLIGVWKSDRDDRIFAKINKNRLGRSGQKFEITIDPETLRLEQDGREVEVDVPF